MATYYVRKTGSDSNNGTSAATAWLTVGKALATGTTVASGDTVYIGAGTYRETVVCATPTTPAAQISIIGDVDGAQTGDPGDVVITAYTTNDTTAPATAAVLDLNGKSNLLFQNLVLVGAYASAPGIDANVSHSQNITLRGCTIIYANADNSAYGAIRYTGIASTAANWLIDQCIIFGGAQTGTNINIAAATNSTADNDINFVVQNTVFYPNGLTNHIAFTGTGALSFKPGGVIVNHCTFLGGWRAVNVGAGVSTTIPCRIYHSLALGQYSGALSASVSGSLVEDYNRILCAVPRNAVTAGAGSIADYTHAVLVEMGQALITGRMGRPFLMPMAGSPLLGRATNASYPLATDYSGRPRPAGGQSTSRAWGYLERHDTAARETTTVDAGGVGLVITGPGDHDLLIPVDATSTTITIRARYDTAGDNTTANRPQAQLLANGEIGVTAQTVTMAGANNIWETLTFSAFTPTGRGVMTLRLLNRSQAGTGKAFFDTVTVS